MAIEDICEEMSGVMAGRDKNILVVALMFQA